MKGLDASDDADDHRELPTTTSLTDARAFTRGVAMEKGRVDYKISRIRGRF